MTQMIAFALIASLGMLVQSVVGFAGSLLAVPLFALLMSPREAVPAYAFLLFVVNGFLVFEGRRHIAWRSVRGLLLGGLPGVPLGAVALKYLPTDVIGAAISGVTLLFGLLFLARVRVRFPVHPATEPLIGLLSGILGGGISESGPPVVVYGLSREWAKDVFRSSLLSYFLCLSVAAMISYLALGMVTGAMLLLALVALAPALAAARLGVWLKQRIPERVFRLAVLATIIAVSVGGLLKHVLG